MYQFNPFTGQVEFVQDKSLVPEKQKVDTFADLPDPTQNEERVYLVKRTTGIPLINRRLRGFYRSDGVVWLYLGLTENELAIVATTGDYEDLVNIPGNLLKVEEQVVNISLGNNIFNSLLFSSISEVEFFDSNNNLVDLCYSTSGSQITIDSTAAVNNIKLSIQGVD